MHHLTGHGNVPGDYNPGVAVPVWPTLLALLFHWTGVSILAARALNVAISMATLAIVYFLVRRYTDASSETPAMLAVLLLAVSPFAFVFSRLAILDTFVIFQFCLLMLVASFVAKGRSLPLAILVLLATIIVLTKTTAVLLLPAVAWLALTASTVTATQCLWVATAVGFVPAILLRAYTAIVVWRGFGADRKYFFDVNAMPDIEWDHAFATTRDLVTNCLWVDRILYPAAAIALILAVVWLRKLWKNPLFTASWIAILCQATFIFARQDDYGPRYFLPMLVPMILIVVVAVDALRLRYRKLYLAAVLTLAVAVLIDTATIVSFIRHRTFAYYDAALSIRGIVTQDPRRNSLILGVSGSQISLMTGLPSINDAFGTQDLAGKLMRYNPGWYVVWNGIADSDQAALAPFQFERMASYQIFDDDDRNLLILYRMSRRESKKPPEQK